ncbi:MAG: phosphate-starvation-inducible PsiE family protein [Xanthobacteraceae bacterium]
MLDFKTLQQEWHELTSYQQFEQVVSRIIMAFVAIVIVYSVILAAIELAVDFTLGRAFMEQELIQDVFGSILTILILLEFNHSIAIALKHKVGIVQARTVVLIAILVIARKIILLDFKTASIETLAGHAGVALALGALYWLILVANRPASPEHGAQPTLR